MQIRKRQLNDKRRIIGGKHLITETKLIEIRKTEEVIKQRKVSKKNVDKWKGKSNVKNESSDEFEVYIDITNDEDVEILDCIEVEM